MKKVLLGFILCASLGAQGQSSVYHPFPDSNAIWMETVWWMFPSNPPQCGQRDYVLFISGDTIIGSYSYKKILSSGYSHMCPFGPGVNYYSNRYVGAFRQDTSLKQVFYVPENSSIENLLYDFNLNVGDTLPVTYNSFFPNVYVTSIDSILTGSDYRKLYWLSIERGWGEYAFLIEGIGSSYGLLNRFEPWFESGSYLRCFTLEQQTIYQDSNFTCNLDVSIAETSENISSVIIFPNPATSEIKIENAKSKIVLVEIYDVMGGKVFKSRILNPDSQISVDVSALKPGIYFLTVKQNQSVTTRKIVIQ